MVKKSSASVFRESLMLYVLVLYLAACSGTGGPTGPIPAGKAIGVAVDGLDNVYISGVTGTTTGNGIYGWPSYWLNGALTQMYSDSDFWVNQDAVDSSGNLYVAGAVGNIGPTAAYWGNGALTSLPMNSNWNGIAYGTDISQGSVYFVGEVGNFPSIQRPCYWKDGTFRDLPFGGVPYDYGWAVGAAFDGQGKAYIAGRAGNSDNDLVPCYWLVKSPSGTVTVKYLKMNTGNAFGVA